MSLSTLNIQLPDEAATLAFAADLARAIDAGGVIHLHGELGAGKTTLVRGILQAMGHQGAVKSPTYTLVEPYSIAEREIYHFDLYRLCDAEELEYMGIRDYFHEHSLCLLEWPEKGKGFLPRADLIIEIRYLQQGRELCCRAETATGQAMLVHLADFTGKNLDIPVSLR